MPDTISLRAYLARLEEQLRMHATDEVVHHCRHILQYFPKHADTYRLLGRALLDNARWDEATAVLRRVLAVYPDDKDAHVGLAEVYSERNQGNQAIWHLERAFEQDPNNEDLIASLRDFYKRFQGTDYSKIQLTAGAIARQYVRNGLYEQGIDTVQRALEGHEERVDLQLLLAQMLWGAEQPVEAAEVALDVLALLPDCLEANRILTQLWLLEDRPSDAQRYINHIEAVDPYTALELATDTEAPDNAFTLPELDYRRYAESVLTSNQPDWLQDIGEGSMAAVFGEPAHAPQRSEPPPVDDTPDEADVTAVPDDWLTESDKARFKPTSGLARATDEMPEVDLNFDDVDSEATASTTARDLRQETSLHASIYNAPQEGGEAPDWLADADEPEQALPQQIESGADPLAWLRDSGIEIDESEPAPVDMPKFESLPPDDEDPLAWMQGSGIEFEDAADATPEMPDGEEDDADAPAWLRDSGIALDDADLAALTHEHPVVRADDETEDEEDPLAWLRSSDVEIDDVAPAPQELDPYETADDTPIQDPASDPLGWMSDYSADIVWDEAAAPAQPPTPVEPPVATPSADSDDDDNPYTWLYESGIEFTPDEPAASAAAPPSPAALDDAEDDFNWLQDESLLDDAPTPNLFDAPPVPNLFDDEPDEPQPSALADEDRIVTGLLRRLSATDAGEGAPLDENAATADAVEFESLIDGGGSAQAPAPQDAETADRREAMSDKDHNLNPDWNGDDENAAGDGGSPDWLRDFEVDNEAPAQPAEDIPEWLAALGPHYAQPESTADEPKHAPEAGDDAAFSWASELEDDDEPPVERADSGDDAAFSWAADIEDDDATPSAQPNRPEDFPDWLQAQELAAAPTDDESNPNWLSEFQAEVEEETAPDAEAESVAAAEIPDWLSELQPPEAGGAPVAAALSNADEDDESDESFGWIDQMIEQEESGEIAQPVADVAAAPEWTPDFERDDATDDEPMALEMPDWLNSLTDAEASTSETPDSEDDVVDVETFEWASEIEQDELPVASAPVEDAVAPETDDADFEPVTDAAPQGRTDTFAWTNEFDKTAPMTPVEDDTPEWLKDFEVADEMAEPPAEDATVVTVQPGEQPDWLAETFAPEAEDTVVEAEPEPEPAVSALDEFEMRDAEAEETPELESEHRPAQNAPDWLNAMVPGVDLDYDATEGEDTAAPEPAPPVSERRQGRDFEWLVDIVEEETQPAPEPAVAAEPTAPRFSFSKLPAWLRGKQAAAGDSAD